MWQKHFDKYKSNTSIFNSREELKNYLENLLRGVGSKQEYNIYLHQINDYYDDVNNLYGADAVKSKVFGILDKGFYISRYSALSGTAKMAGSTEFITGDDILDYEYYTKLNYKAICVVAIPKYISVDGEMVEYSSYNGQDSWSFPEDLTNEYIKIVKSAPELHYFKCCLFDAIKSYNDLPSCYMLGMVTIDKNNEQYAFIETGKHLYRLPEYLVLKHNNSVENKIKNLYEKYNTRDRKTVIVEAFKEDQVYYDSLDTFDI